MSSACASGKQIELDELHLGNCVFYVCWKKRGVSERGEYGQGHG